MRRTTAITVLSFALVPAIGISETIGTTSHSYTEGDTHYSTRCTTTRGDKSGKFRTSCYTSSYKVIPFRESVIGSWWAEKKRKKKQRRLKAEKFESDIQALEELRGTRALEPEPRSLNAYLDSQVDEMIAEWVAEQSESQ